MKRETTVEGEQYGSFGLDEMAVGPYCVLDDIDSNDTSHRDSLSPPTGDVSVVKEGGEMDGMEYPFLDGQGWPVTSADGMHYDRTTSPHVMTNGMMPNGGWDSFLHWTPGQNQDSGDVSTPVSAPSRFAQSFSNSPSLYSRRAGTLGGQPSIELSGGGVPTSTPGSASTPFTFGQAVCAAPAFDFTSPGAMISPMDKQGLQFGGHHPSSSRSPVESGLGSVNSPYAGAMPPPAPPSTSSFHQSPSSNHARIGTSDSAPSSPDHEQRPQNLKKRKSDDSDEMTHDPKGGPPKKTAHNMIEKRYRTNLNDKIAALRDSVPSLRVMSRSNGAEEEDDEVDWEGLAPAHKLNKATVLSKATEYIRHLEKRNKKLQDEVIALKKQMDSYEKMTMNSFAFPGGVPTPEGVRYDQNPFEHVSPRVGGPNPVRGMIPIPQDLQQMRESTIHGQPYGTSAANYPVYAPTAQQQTGPGRPVVNGRGSNFMNKMMVGSLAGLMLFEGFVEREKSGEEPEGRGLFALPISLISDIGGFLWPRSLMFGASPHDVLALLRVCLVIGALVYVLLPLLEFKPRPKKKTAAAVSLAPVPAIASPIDVRREAWLTAIQTVWVPQHQFILEAAALLLKTLKLSTRKLIGWQGYAFVWNVTKEQETARVKAWSIALDAQLTGGDAEISMSRLVLTLLASGTLPDTPSRLMLKSLHIRVLLWEVANAGYGTWYMLDELSMKLARRYWNQARLEHKLYKNSRTQQQRQEQSDEHELPAHLAALLELSCDQVLVKPIIQRAYNLAWNRPSSENTQPDVSTDSVVNDFAISSPLDALAAWFSSLLINHVLEHSLRLDQSKSLLTYLEKAIAIAPPMSAVQLRAMAAKAVLVRKDRLQHVEAAVNALPKPPSTRNSSDADPALNTQPLLIVPNTPVPMDVPVALMLAKCLALVETESLKDQDHETLRNHAVAALLQYRPTESNFSILSFAAAYRVLDHFAVDPVLSCEARPVLERMANAMRVWIGKDAGRPAVAAISPKIRTKVVERCIVASKLLTGVRVDGSDVDDDESDAGYGSLEEEPGKAGAIEY